MDAKPLLIVLPGTLTKGAIRKAERAGYVVLETETPEAVMPVQIDPLPLVHQGIIARAALESLAATKGFQSADERRADFARRLLGSLLTVEAPNAD